MILLKFNEEVIKFRYNKNNFELIKTVNNYINCINLMILFIQNKNQIDYRKYCHCVNRIH